MQGHMRLSRTLQIKGIYLALMTAASFLGFFKVILYAKLISVSEFGIYSLVLSSYIFFVFFGGMGLQEGILKKGSESHAVGDIKAIKAYFLAALAFAIPVSGSVAIMLMIAIKFSFPASYEIQDVVGVGVVMALATILFNLIDAFLRAQQKFLLFAGALALKNSIAISLGYSWAIEHGVEGLVIAEIIGLLVPFFALIFLLFSPQDLTLYKGKHAGNLIKSGYKLMLAFVLRNITLFVDRWFVAGALGVIAVGYYSFSMIILTICLVLIGFVVTIQGPKWISEMHIHKDICCLIKDVNKTTLKMLACVILAGPFFILNIENILESFHPDYAEAVVIKLFLIMYLAVLATIPIYLYEWIFVANSEEGSLVKINLLATVVSVVLYCLLWVIGSDILYFGLVFLFNKILILMYYLKKIRAVYVFQST